MSVSTVVRNVLLTTFGLVEDIVNDSTDIALAVTGQETGPRRARPRRGRGGGDVRTRSLAWQDAVLNRERGLRPLQRDPARRACRAGDRHPRAARAPRHPLPVVPGRAREAGAAAARK